MEFPDKHPRAPLPRTASIGLAVGLLIAAGGYGESARAEPLQPGAISGEFLTGNVELPPSPSLRFPCTNRSGVTHKVVDDCGEEASCDTVDFYLERVDANGTKLGPNVALTNGSIVARNSWRILCLEPAGVVVTYNEISARVDSERDLTCARYQAVDGDGLPLREAAAISDDDECTHKPVVLLQQPDGQVLTLLSESLRGGGSGIVATTFDPKLGSFGSLLTVSAQTPVWRSQPNAAIDRLGTTLVGWIEDDAEWRDQVSLRFIAPSGEVVGDVIAANEFPYGESRSIFRIVPDADEPGVFTVYWRSAEQGGQVGRRFAIDPGAIVTSTTTTTLPPAPEFPPFESAHVLDETGLSSTPDEYETRTQWLGRTEWMIDRGTTQRVANSANDGRTWEGPIHRDPPDGLHGRPYQAALLDDGSWIGIGIDSEFGDGIEDVFVVFSPPGEWAWQIPAHSIEQIHNLSNDCYNCDIRMGRLARGQDGVWLATWGWSDWKTDQHYNHDGTQDAQFISIISASRSPDGRTWSAPVEISRNEGSGAYGLATATDDHGNWILTWGDEDGVRVSRSNDNALTWTSPESIVSTPIQWAGNERDAIVLESVGSDTWLLAFSSKEYVADFGADLDVLFLKSIDNGQSWQGPNAVAEFAHSDGASDRPPDAAVGPNGRIALVWSSHQPTYGPNDTDSDILLSVSEDRGESWSTPVPANEDSSFDAAADGDPSIAVSDQGTWMLSWWRTPLDGPRRMFSSELMVRTTATKCGNENVDPGEECDDGNNVDGDGCDSNCTTTRCGNAVRTGNEECDDGNTSELDACTNACASAVCGDGLHRPSKEPCDDGDDDNHDWCLNDCRRASCTDGFVHEGHEECDDGNVIDDDACTNRCKLGACGDGITDAPHEECDDGNDSDLDSCLNNCRAARCGDGIQSLTMEQCDPAIEEHDPYCSTDCRFPVPSDSETTCGDTDLNGRVTASDALAILVASIESIPKCPRMLCDRDGNGDVTSTDALATLRESLGLESIKACPISGRIVLSTKDEREMTSIDLTVDHSSAGGWFLHGGPVFGCVTRLDVVARPYLTRHDLAGVDGLSIASQVVFSGPGDLVACDFLPEHIGAIDELRVKVRFAVSETADSFAALNPTPVIDYRIE